MCVFFLFSVDGFSWFLECVTFSHFTSTRFHHTHTIHSTTASISEEHSSSFLYIPFQISPPPPRKFNMFPEKRKEILHLPSITVIPGIAVSFQGKLYIFQPSRGLHLGTSELKKTHGFPPNLHEAGSIIAHRPSKMNHREAHVLACPEKQGKAAKVIQL